VQVAIRKNRGGYKPAGRPRPPLTAEQQALVNESLAYARHRAMTMAQQLTGKFQLSGSLAYDLFEQLLGAAYEGLCRGAQRFEKERGWTFLTYAAWWVLRALNEEVPMLFLAVGRKDSKNRQFVSLETGQPSPTNEHEHNFLDNNILDLGTGESQQVQAQQELDQQHEKLWQVLARELTPRRRYVIWRRVIDGAPLAQIGKEMGICRERVGQLEVSSLNRLRKNPYLLSLLDKRMSDTKEELSVVDFHSDKFAYRVAPKGFLNPNL
jgi:RNA polymerase sigma factor (sigma-70 family)